EGLGLLAHLLGRPVHRHLDDLLTTATSAARADDAPTGGDLAGGLADGHGRLAADLVLRRRAVGEDLALVDPHLHAGASERGARLGPAIVDVGPQRVQRNAALAVPLLARHLRAPEATAALDPDALCSRLHRGLHRTLHGPAERDAPGQLVRDALRNERRVQL